jgi:hypothetical protein
MAVVRVTTVGKKCTDGGFSPAYVKSIRGRFEHTSECVIARPIAAPVLKLHPLVREHAAQLVRMNVRSAQILYENMQYLSREFDGAIATEEFRLLLLAQVRYVCPCMRANRHGF